MGNKKRVLLVDDEPDVVYLVKRGLERIGFEVDGYTDPMLALQNYQNGIYFLLVLDVKMPKMNGIEFFKRIDKEDGKVKVCFFSATERLMTDHKSSFRDFPDRFLFISKPISICEMTTRIKSFLNGS